MTLEDTGKSLPVPARLLVVVGPTAVGKTRLSLYLARRFDGVIISADSRQIYRGMDIGTDKVSPAERDEIPHRLIDILSPDEPFSLAEYQTLARREIDAVHVSGRLPMLVGGTGQYVRAVVEGWGIPRVPPQPAIREALEADASRGGPEGLHDRLMAVDPEAAGRIDPRNVRRVIRALEVYQVTGKPISELQRKEQPTWAIMQIGLLRDRAEMYARIDARVDAMLAAGLVDEVLGLLEKGFSPELPSMSGLGYRQIGASICGDRSLEEAVKLIKRETRRFVHQQMTWFRTGDPAIEWFHADNCAGIESRVTQWIQETEDNI